MKHFVILGKLQSKYDFRDYNDDVTVISMNKHFDAEFLERVDYWFDLHENPENKEAQFTKQNFPFEECHKLVGRRFYTTMAYMIAWCVLQNADKISIYGAKFTDDGNIRRQRELHNVREMLFYCMGKGIEIFINPNDIDDLFPEHIVDDGEDFDQ